MIELQKLQLVGVHFRRGGRTFGFYKCQCGTVSKIRVDHVKSGLIKSCGCLQSIRMRELKTKHGHCKRGARTSEFSSWVSMRQRCLDKNSKAWPRYGGRGIKICDRWLDSFENFLADMGKKPSPLHSIERKDNNGNYGPDNCIWATAKEQANNRRSNHKVELDGKNLTLSQWSSETGIPMGTISVRLRQGWPERESIFTPV